MFKECPNCELALEEIIKYCPECGQKTNLHRLNLSEILHEAIHYFTHADKSFIQLLKQLTLKTGKVAKEYISGKRKKYFPPLNFYLLVATIFVLIINVATGSQSTPNVLKEHPEINSISDQVRKKKIIKIYERQGIAINFMNKYSNIVAMIALPLICLIYWIFYIKGTYNYTEHLVACLYMIGFANLIYALFFVPVTLLLGIKHSNSSLISVIIFMIFQIIYNSIFYYRFINKNTYASAFKAICVSLFAVVFWFALSSILVGSYISNAFWGYAS